MKYEIDVWLVNGSALRDTVEAPEDVDLPRGDPYKEWKRPIQVEVERLVREGYHRAGDSYPSLPHTYYPPHSIQRITYREAGE